MSKSGVTSVTISGAGKSVTLGPGEKMEDNAEVREITEKVLDNAGVGQFSTFTTSNGVKVTLRPVVHKHFCIYEKCAALVRPGENGAIFEHEGGKTEAMHLACYYAWAREQREEKSLNTATKERTGQTSIDPETGEILTEEERTERHIVTKVKSGEIPINDRRLGERFEITLTVRCVGKGREINKEGFEFPTQKLEITGINREF